MRTPPVAPERSPSPPWVLWLFPLECKEQLQLLYMKHTCPLWTEIVCTRDQFSPKIVCHLGTSFLRSFELSAWPASDYVLNKMSGGTGKEKRGSKEKRRVSEIAQCVRELAAKPEDQSSRPEFPSPTW